jgi:hypothetical protein
MIPRAAVNHSEAAVVSPATLKNPCLEDHACPEKADAGHDALRHATRIGAKILVDRDAEPARLIDGDEHQHRRAEANERVGAEPGRPSVEAPLETDQTASGQRRSKPNGDVDCILGHA